MCGIAGRSSRPQLDAAFARELSAAMGNALRNRGPDSTGFHHDLDTLLVHRRLSIFDLSAAGSQPMWNEDRTVCIIVNGEIYNFEDLRRTLQRQGHRFSSRSDSEVILHLYEERGIRGCCTALEGMFAFALWDARTRDLYLVRDRLGIKPLIIAEHAQGVTFGSTMKGLLADPGVPREVRADAFAAVMRWGFVPSPWSVLRSARHVEPGTFLRVRAGCVVEEVTWWRDAPVPERATVEDVRSVVASAVRSHLLADVPVGVLLSAGIDSGLIAALASRSSSPGEIQAWTASQRGFPEDEYVEAARTAEHLGMQVHEVPVGVAGATADSLAAVVEAMDEPLAVASLVGLHALFRAIAPDRRVVLSGDGGDELFAGYDWHIGMPAMPWWSRGGMFRAAAPLLAGRALGSGPLGTLSALATLSQRHPASIYLDKLRIATDDELASMGIADLRDDPMEHRAVEAWDRFAGAGTLEQMLAVDRATSLVDEMLAKVDTASMAYAVEVRVPFLADRVLATAKGLPPADKRIAGQGKTALRQWFRELGPPDAATRAKSGFNSPVGAWFEGPAGEYLNDHALLGVDLLGMTRLPRSPRLMFAAAVVGAWHERLDAYGPTPARRAS